MPLYELIVWTGSRHRLFKRLQNAWNSETSIALNHMRIALGRFSQDPFEVYEAVNQGESVENQQDQERNTDTDGRDDNSDGRGTTGFSWHWRCRDVLQHWNVRTPFIGSTIEFKLLLKPFYNQAILTNVYRQGSCAILLDFWLPDRKCLWNCVRFRGQGIQWW